MTQEEKNLLLKDLLPRLIYGVKIQTWYGEIITSDLNTFQIGYDEIDIEQLAGMKPYLRPMSSMTEEEIDEYREIQDTIIGQWDDCDRFIGFTYAHSMIEYIDWLNVHHFDYRGLIPKGLALEAPEGMYNIKHTKSEQEQIEELAEIKKKLSK